jgi:periplasmic divalent cation tolerance protein
MGLIIIYITNPTKRIANKISMHLLKKRLIACANIFPIDSMYWWKGKIEKAKEVVLIAKTRKENFEKVKEEVKKIHPYSVPSIEKLEVETNEEYEKWLNMEIK